jgi:uncharacterized protein
VSTSPSRVAVLDVLRAVALGGILLINAMSILAVKGSTPAFTVEIPPLERALQDAILFCVESKFFTLFSLLFGISFAIQIGSAQRQGAAFLPRISRRLLALLVIGLLHILLLWDGDILVIYALTGTLLIAMRNLTDRALRRWIIGLLAIPATLVLIALVVSLAVRWGADGSAAMTSSDLDIASQFADTSASSELAHATFLQGAQIRIGTYISLLPLLLSRIPTVLAMFLIGLLIGRSGFLASLPEQRPTLRHVRNVTFAIGLPVMALIVLATKVLPTTSALIAIIEDQYITGPLLCLGLASTITLGYLNSPGRRVFAWIQPMGQMALTNYLSQSLVMTFLAYGWGLGLALRLNGFAVLAAAVALYVVQASLSWAWLRRYSYGPCEWVWRCVTYGRWMPIRRAVRVTA